MELWDAYDKDGKCTGGTLVRGEVISDGLYHLVCEVLVRSADGSVLCMKRAASKQSYPGLYEATAGGSALRGEDARTCVRRELREETGIECDTFEEIGCFTYDDDHCIFHCFVCSVGDKPPVTLQAGETEDFVWMTEAEFAAFVRSGNMIPTQKRRYAGYLQRMGYWQEKRAPEYAPLTAENLEDVVRGYVRYYNDCENGCWTAEKARKRIHQVMTMEDAECVVRYDGGELTGFWMGYYKEFDDLKAYFLEEIVVFSGWQNQGCGTAMLTELERRVKVRGAAHIELISVNDERHMHFYHKLGFYPAGNLVMMGKHFD